MSVRIPSSSSQLAELIPQVGLSLLLLLLLLLCQCFLDVEIFQVRDERKGAAVCPDSVTPVIFGELISGRFSPPPPSEEGQVSDQQD